MSLVRSCGLKSVASIDSDCNTSLPQTRKKGNAPFCPQLMQVWRRSVAMEWGFTRTKPHIAFSYLPFKTCQLAL